MRLKSCRSRIVHQRHLEHKLALAGAAEKTRRNSLNILAAVLDHAIAARLIEANPALRVHLTRPEHGEIDWEVKAEEEAAESEEVEKYIAPLDEGTAAAYTEMVLSRYKPTQTVRAFLIEALWTGKRRGEMHGGK